jgi:hypothetical protein
MDRSLHQFASCTIRKKFATTPLEFVTGYYSARPYQTNNILEQFVLTNKEWTCGWNAGFISDQKWIVAEWCNRVRLSELCAQRDFVRMLQSRSCFCSRPRTTARPPENQRVRVGQTYRGHLPFFQPHLNAVDFFSTNLEPNNWRWLSWYKSFINAYLVKNETLKLINLQYWYTVLYGTW